MNKIYKNSSKVYPKEERSEHRVSTLPEEILTTDSPWERGIQVCLRVLSWKVNQ